MPKGQQRGNKEAKKQKKSPTPVQPATPVVVAPKGSGGAPKTKQ